MPLPGGDADKAGNRYELRWTVRQFIRLLTDDAVWIELEPVGEEGDRIEFCLCRSDGEIEVHQVKRQQAGKAHWTIADPRREAEWQEKGLGISDAMHSTASRDRNVIFPK
jgi:hypothetical protein